MFEINDTTWNLLMTETSQPLQHAFNARQMQVKIS